MSEDRNGASAIDELKSRAKKHKGLGSGRRLTVASYFSEKEAQILLGIIETNNCTQSEAVRIAIRAYKGG